MTMVTQKSCMRMFCERGYNIKCFLRKLITRNCTMQKGQLSTIFKAFNFQKSNFLQHFIFWASYYLDSGNQRSRRELPPTKIASQENCPLSNPLQIIGPALHFCQSLLVSWYTHDVIISQKYCSEWWMFLWLTRNTAETVDTFIYCWDIQQISSIVK